MSQENIDAERLRTAKHKIGQVIEGDSLDWYPKGQLGVALRLVEKYENHLREQSPMEDNSDV